MLIIDEIFFICNRMLTFINGRLCDIKQLHNKFMGCFDVIVTNDFYQNSTNLRFTDFQIKN